MLRQTTSLDVVSIRCQNNMDKSTWRNGRYFIEFEIQVDVGLSTWNQCHLFDVNSMKYRRTFDLELRCRLKMFPSRLEKLIVANAAKTLLAKGTSFFIKRPANLPNKARRNPPDLIILDNCPLLSFISVDILSAKAIFILVFYLVVRRNSCGNSSS